MLAQTSASTISVLSMLTPQLSSEELLRIIEREVGRRAHNNGSRPAAGHFGVGAGASVFHMFALSFQLPFTCCHTLRYLPRSVTWSGPYVTT